MNEKKGSGSDMVSPTKKPPKHGEFNIQDPAPNPGPKTVALFLLLCVTWKVNAP